MSRFFLLLSLVLFSAPSSGAQVTPGEDLPVLEHTLENGLRLLILPRSGAPTVSFVVQYAIGSVNEAPGQTGIAHLLEHLLFKGTRTVGTRDYRAEVPLHLLMDRLHDSIMGEIADGNPDEGKLERWRSQIRGLEEEASAYVINNEFDAILTQNGARSLNATTDTESTTYFVELPSNRTELWFLLEGDRMGNPVFREFYTERDVVTEERRMRLEDNPAGLLYEAHLAAAFTRHPYGAPVVGTMEDLRTLSRPAVRDYFNRFYTPNNAVVTVVGDVDPRQILRWARRYLGSIPAGEPPPPVEATEPEQTEERRVEVFLDAEPNLRVGWRSPPADHPDAPALAMLASILTGGRSSRLYRRLVIEDRTATAVTSGTGPGVLYPGLFSIDAVPRSPHSPQEIEQAIYEELERLKVEPPDEMELQRVRNRLEASSVRRLTSNLGLALQIAGSASLYGDWRRTFAYTRRMGEVTSKDVQRVVRRYFREDQRTVATLLKATGEGGDPVQ